MLDFLLYNQSHTCVLGLLFAIYLYIQNIPVTPTLPFLKSG